MTVVIILDSLLCNCPVVDSFLSFVFDWLWILSVSLQFLFNRWLLLLIAGFKLKNSLTKWQSPPQNSREKNHPFSENSQDSCLSSAYLITLFPLFVCSSLHLCLSCSVAQFQSPTSASLEFLHSLSLPVLSKTQLEKAFSRLMRVLSHSDTHYLNRHMVGCGCHEILTQRCITVPFLSDFSLHPIQLWFLWLSYSNHSFQLIIFQ